MKTKYPKTFEYFFKFKKELEKRSIYKLWGKGNPFYSVYDIGAYTFYPYKVVWKELGELKGVTISGKAVFSSAVIEKVENLLDLVGIKDKKDECL